MLETRTAHYGVVDSIKTLQILIKTLNPLGLERKLRKGRSTEGKGIVRTYGNFMVKAGLEQVLNLDSCIQDTHHKLII